MAMAFVIVAIVKLWVHSTNTPNLFRQLMHLPVSVSLCVSLCLSLSLSLFVLSNKLFIFIAPLSEE